MPRLRVGRRPAMIELGGVVTCFLTRWRSVPVLLLATAAAAAALGGTISDTTFSGRWRLDTSSLVSGAKPTTFRLAGGLFRKNSEEPVRADGQPHRVASDGYVDEVSITVKNDLLVSEVDRIRGKLAYAVDYVVSADGQTLTSHVTSYTSPSGQPVQTQDVQRRVGPVVKGAHILSGQWKRISIAADAKSDWLLKLDGRRFSWRTEAGIGYDALIGGASVPIDGDNSGARAAITRPRSDTIVETDFSAKGQVDDVLSMQLLPDHATIRATAWLPRVKRRSTFFLHRVPD